MLQDCLCYTIVCALRLSVLQNCLCCKIACAVRLSVLQDCLCCKIVCAVRLCCKIVCAARLSVLHMFFNFNTLIITYVLCEVYERLKFSFVFIHIAKLRTSYWTQGYIYFILQGLVYIYHWSMLFLLNKSHCVAGTLCNTISVLLYFVGPWVKML